MGNFSPSKAVVVKPTVISWTDNLICLSGAMKARVIVTVDLSGRIYKINEYTKPTIAEEVSVAREPRYELCDRTRLHHIAESVIRIPETGIDLRSVYATVPD